MRGIVFLPAKYPVSFRRNSEHGAIDFAAYTARVGSVVIDGLLLMAACMIEVLGIAVVILRGAESGFEDVIVRMRPGAHCHLRIDSGELVTSAVGQRNPGRGPRSRVRPQRRVDPFGEFRRRPALR
jgi:hypothetical protein